MRLLKYWLPPVLWAGLIFSFSSLQVKPAVGIYWQDFILKKTAHVIEYFTFYTLLYRALKNTANLGKNVYLWALVILICYAVSDKFHQSFTPGREPTLRDVLIDTGAGTLALFSIWKFLPKAPRKLLTLAKTLQIV